MKGRLLLALVVPALLAAWLATSSLGVVSSSLVVRGNATALDLHDKSEKLKLQAKEPIHVDVRFVTMGGGDVIDWHGHLGPSLLVVKTGSLTVTESDGNACSVKTYGTGETFIHPESAHKFVAGGSGAEFYIVYLLPESALPSPIGMSAPPACL